MRYIIIDAEIGGTGIRDKYESGYIELVVLNLSDITNSRISDWQTRYQNEHYNNFKDSSLIAELDKEGMELALTVKNELSEAKVEYCSAATLKCVMV